MTTNHPFPLRHGAPLPEAGAIARAHAVREVGAWRYGGAGRSRAGFYVALLVSAGLHAGILFGHGLLRTTEPPKKKVEAVPVITITMPEVKDLEEIDPMPVDESDSKPDLGQLVPMQADVPQIPRPDDFVQQVDFSSLVERPDFKDANLLAIPEAVRRPGKGVQGLGAIFNIADLDRQPQPVFQPSPVFPMPLRREVVTATVEVEFIVDIEGRVLNAFVVDTSDLRFNDAAIAGVSKWRFRAGMKGGRRVNIRMRVPIIFRLMDEE